MRLGQSVRYESGDFSKGNNIGNIVMRVETRIRVGAKEP